MELLTIGRFAELTGLTPRALRHYERLGLLVPVLVDETNRYRYYAPEQRRTAEAIQRLRAADLPLEDVRVALEQPELLPAIVGDRLARLEDLRGRLLDLTEEEIVHEEKFQIRFWLTIDEGPPRLLRLRREGNTEQMPDPRPLLDDVVAENGLVPLGEPETVELEPGVVEVRWAIGPEGELKPPREGRFLKRVESP
jgi:DNA-binding transcriptional MerR regulator